MFRVVSTEDFDKQFAELQKRAREGDTESVYLVKIIEKGIEKLKFNYKYGDHVSREKIPKEYIEKYSELIEKNGNYLEVFDPDGTPFKSAFYYADEGMLWAANYLALQ